jgi:hypothetical protein
MAAIPDFSHSPGDRWGLGNFLLGIEGQLSLAILADLSARAPSSPAGRRYQVM